METFLVGGAVRDNLLKLDVVDKDYVVVGSNNKEMLKIGFKQVGQSFPVFLHPKTKEEYALARTEIKTGAGYQGFECIANEKVTLEEDLSRRDLTINAIAQNNAGDYIDPHNGIADLNNKILRHVSPAFSEDPVRLLRAARFAAKFAPLGFMIADETNLLMYKMVKQGEVDSLVTERVWQETEKALNTSMPQVYFESLRRCGALKVIFPELDALYGVPATKYFHGEIDTGMHNMMVVAKATELSTSPVVRFASLMHDLGKALTPFSELPSHPGHAEMGEDLVRQLCKRLKVPNKYLDLGVMAAKFHTKAHKCMKLSATGLVEFLYELKVFKDEQRFKNFLIVCQADAYGRIARSKKTYPQADYLWQAYVQAKNVAVQDIINDGAEGEQISIEFKQAQIKAIDLFLALKLQDK